MVDQAKRKSLKTFAVSGMGAAASIYLPAVAASSGKSNAVASENEALEVSGLSIKHYQNFNGHTVLVRNATAQASSLKSIYPTTINTPTGPVKLSKLLQNGTLTVPANSTQAFSITHAGKVERYALWKHIETEQLTAVPASSRQSLKVTGLYNMTGNTGSTRLHAATVV